MYAFKAKAIRISRAKFHCSCLVFFVLFYLFVCYHFLMNKDVYIDLQLYNISKITPVSFLGHSVLGLNQARPPKFFVVNCRPPLEFVASFTYCCVIGRRRLDVKLFR